MKADVLEINYYELDVLICHDYCLISPNEQNSNANLFSVNSLLIVVLFLLPIVCFIETGVVMSTFL